MSLIERVQAVRPVLATLVKALVAVEQEADALIANGEKIYGCMSLDSDRAKRNLLELDSGLEKSDVEAVIHALLMIDSYTYEYSESSFEWSETWKKKSGILDELMSKVNQLLRADRVVDKRAILKGEMERKRQ